MWLSIPLLMVPENRPGTLWDPETLTRVAINLVVLLLLPGMQVAYQPDELRIAGDHQ